MLHKLSVAMLLCVMLSSITLVAQQTSTDPPAPLVDINSAPARQIEELVRDEQIAAMIVEGRPYANKRQLLTRNLVSAEEYERIKDRIVARRVEPTP